ncbi:MAG: CDP-diacylglycerol--glycerol-3-phosphate 3-phosphatidyltransferase [Zetaproteobacteria bacterium]|nr:MAG: CDP-diacylglycerol--glycerol-3-phosphate 3-phosphatidyltransferase [Zetaproteobacteria bacterium]
MDIIKNNLANILTVARLFLLPVIIFLFYVEDTWGSIAAWLCLLVYAIAAATDFFDGYIARKYNQITDFGTFLDPISDKIFVSTLLILLVAFGQIQGLWIICVILIFAREFLVSGLREFLGPKNIQMPVTKLAKCKTMVQMLSLGFLIIGQHAPYTLELGQVLLALATGLTLITGISYMFVGLKHIKD